MQSNFRKHLGNYLSKIANRQPEINAGRVKSFTKSKTLLERSFGTDLPKKGTRDLVATVEAIDSKMKESSTNWTHKNFVGFFPSRSTSAPVLGEVFYNLFMSNNAKMTQSRGLDHLEREFFEALRQNFGLDESFSSKNGGTGIMTPTVGNGSVLITHYAKYKKLLEHGNSLDTRKRLVGYYPEVSHGHAVKALVMNEITQMREIPVDFKEETGNFEMSISHLRKAIEEDLANGLIPCIIMGVIGATPTGGKDDVRKVAEIAKKHDVFFYIDAAWAGNFLAVEEYREQLIDGHELADAFIINPTKGIGTGSDTTFLFLKDEKLLAESFELGDCPDRTLSSLKIGDNNKVGIIKAHFWAQSMGIEGLKDYLREKVKQANYIRKLIADDDRFEEFPKSSLSLVNFRLKKVEGHDQMAMNRRLVEKLWADEDLFLVAALVGGNEYWLRISTNGPVYSEEDMENMFGVVQRRAEEVFTEFST